MNQEQQPRFTQARNKRQFSYKYYSIKGEDTKKMAVLAGRCTVCNKVTDSFCDNCQEYVCENHSHIPNKDECDCYCLKCKDNLNL